LQSEEEYKIELLKGIIVSLHTNSSHSRKFLRICIGKKQKKRLEDLERRAGSSPPSDDESPSELSPQLQSYSLSDDHDTQLHEAYSSYNPNFLSTQDMMYGNSYLGQSQLPVQQKSPRHRHSLQSERPSNLEMHGRSLSDPSCQYSGMPQITLGNMQDTLLQDGWLLQHGFNRDKLSGNSDPTLALSQPIDNLMLNVPSLAIDNQEYLYDSYVPTSMPWESPSWSENNWSSRTTPMTNMTLHTPPLSTNGDNFFIKDESSRDLFGIDGHDVGYEDPIHWADVWK